MTDTSGFVRIRGSLYSAIPRYSSLGELDEIAKFFYERVLTQENRIERLRNIFGLPARFVEDILVELIRKNFALLNVADGQVVRIPNPTSRRKPVDRPERERKFWQDAVTGMVVDFNAIPTIYYSSEKVQGRVLQADDGPIPELPREARQVRDFIDLPSVRIMSMLNSTSPNLLKDEMSQAYENLDGLVARKRSGDLHLVLPYTRAMIDREPILFIEAPELPGWLVQVWSRELNALRAVSPRLPSLRLYLRGSSREMGVRGLTLLDACSLRFCTRSWLQSVKNLASHGRRDGLEPLRHRYESTRNVLIEMLDRLACIDFAQVDGQGSCHLSEMWTSAGDYMMVISTRLDATDVQSLVQTLGAPESWKVPFLLLAGPLEGDSVSTLKEINAPIDYYQRLELMQALDTACLVDSRELRLGSFQDLLGNAPLLRIVGGTVVRDFARVAVSFCAADADESEWYVHSLINRTRPDLGLSLAAHGQATSVNRPEHLRRLIEETDILLKRAIEKARQAWEKIDSERLDIVVEAEGPPTTVRAYEPLLIHHEGEIDPWCDERRLPEPLASFHLDMNCNPLQAFGRIVGDLAHDGRRHVVLVTLDTISERVLYDDFIDFLTEALEWCDMSLCLNPSTADGKSYDPTSLEVLGKLESALKHYRLVLKLGRVRAPAAIVVDSEFVVFGPKTWFEDVDGDSWLLAAEAPHVAGKITVLTRNAKQLVGFPEETKVE